MRRVTLAAIAGLSLLTGCNMLPEFAAHPAGSMTSGPANRDKGSFTFTATRTGGSPAAGGSSVRGATVEGPFKIHAFGHGGQGRFFAKFDGNADPSAGTGTASGLALIDTRGKTGYLCVWITGGFSPNGAKGT